MATDQATREAEIAGELSDAAAGAGLSEILDTVNSLRQSGVLQRPLYRLGSTHGDNMAHAAAG